MATNEVKRQLETLRQGLDSAIEAVNAPETLRIAPSSMDQKDMQNDIARMEVEVAALLPVFKEAFGTPPAAPTKSSDIVAYHAALSRYHISIRESVIAATCKRLPTPALESFKPAGEEKPQNRPHVTDLETPPTLTEGINMTELCREHIAKHGGGGVNFTAENQAAAARGEFRQMPRGNAQNYTELCKTHIAGAETPQISKTPQKPKGETLTEKCIRWKEDEKRKGRGQE